MRKMFLALLAVALLSVPLRADLKYTTHMEIKKSDRDRAAANPMIGMMGEAVIKQMVPEGAADVVYLVGEKGARDRVSAGGTGSAGRSDQALHARRDFDRDEPEREDLLEDHGRGRLDEHAPSRGTYSGSDSQADRTVRDRCRDEMRGSYVRLEDGSSDPRRGTRNAAPEFPDDASDEWRQLHDDRCSTRSTRTWWRRART